MTEGEAPALSVSQLHAAVDTALAGAFPHPLWVRGEISGLRRTSRGALFFRLVDEERADRVVEVAARGRIALDVDRALQASRVGPLREGVAVRLRATVGVEGHRSSLRLSLLQVDPAFTAGRLAVDRDAVLGRLAADGSLKANGSLALPLVPLDVGLVTSRGSAAHADFLDHLRRSGFRFRVRTAHASMQGQAAVPEICRALGRMADEEVDVIALVRGGGAKLDLAAFDSEEVGRAVAGAPAPVLTGIGHEIDRTVADAAAAIPLKTPTAVGEWLTARVGDYADRVATARRLIAAEARGARRREAIRLAHSVALLETSRASLEHQREHLRHLGAAISSSARNTLVRQREWLRATQEGIGALGVDETLSRGFALVRDQTGAVVRTAAALGPGARITVRFVDGEVAARVERAP